MLQGVECLGAKTGMCCGSVLFVSYSSSILKELLNGMGLEKKNEEEKLGMLHLMLIH